MSRLEIRLLGEIDVRRDDQLIAFPTKKVKELFAYLVTHRDRAHSRAQLIQLLWSEHQDEKAKTNLRKALSLLRQGLGPGPWLELVESSVRLVIDAKNSWIDFEEFEHQLVTVGTEAISINQLERALSLYRGRFASEIYGDWALAESERLQTLYLEALETLATLYRENQKLELAQQTWQIILKIIPWHERAHRELMMLHALAGDRAAAILQYDAYCAILKKELNAPPLPETQALYERLRQGIDFRPLSLKTEALASELPFVGREHESDVLKNLWQQVCQNQGQALLIAGEAGVGKTRLVHQTITQMQRPHPWVIAGGAYVLGNEVPYQPLIQALGEGVRLLTTNDLEKIPAMWRSELIPFIPELKEKFSELSSNPELPQAQGKARWFAALTAFFERFAQMRPVILFLDDLHWADEATLEYLSYLIAHTKKSSLFLIGTYRLEETREPSALGRWLSQMGSSRAYQPLTLARLSLGETQRLLESWLGHEIRSAFPLLYEETEGNPLFLRELVRSLYQSGAIQRDETGSWRLTLSEIQPIQFPETLRALIQASLRRAPERERSLLKLASVIGRRFDLASLHTISRHSETTLLRSLDTLRQSGLIVEREGIYCFYHEMFRQVIYDELGADRQRLLHRQVGEALERFYSTRVNEQASILSEHFERAQRWDKAITYAISAGLQAQKVYAYGEALKRYSKALSYFENLEEPLNRSLQEKKLSLLSHYTSASVFPTISDLIPAITEIQDAVLQMIALAQELRDNVKLCEAYQRQARVALAQGHREAAQVALRSALELSSEIPDSSAMTVLEQIGRLYRQLGEYSHAFTAYQRMAQAGNTLRNSGVQGKALSDCAVIQLFLGQWNEALRHMEEAHELVHASGDLRLRASVLNNLGVILSRLSRYEQARTCYEQSYQLMNEVSDQRGLGIALLNLGALATDQKQYEKAIADLQRVLGLLISVGLKGLEIETLSELGRAHLGRQEFRLALDYSARAISILEAERGIATEAQRFYFTHYQILKANQQANAAKTYAQKAYDELQRVAGEIREEILRRSFLENISLHRQILQAWEAEQH
jgi:predicted ATPase